MENEEQLFEKISDHYSGEENKEAVEKELENDPETKELFHWINVFWNRLNPKPGRAVVIQKCTYKKIKKSRYSRSFFLRGAAKYAAIILLVLGLSGIAYYYSRENIPLVKVMSGTGEVKEIELPDGSKAWLNARSSLDYPEKFAKKMREVIMTGEVYFEVKHDREHPFVVSSDLVKVTVMGTSFLVSNYADEPTVDTYLAEGSVNLELREPKETMQLVPGDEISFDKKTLAVTKVNNPYIALDSWRFGKLSFYNESLFEIARKLERKFGKKITIPDKNVGNMKYTADFEKENLEQILKFLGEGSEVKYETIKNGYVITKR